MSAVSNQPPVTTRSTAHPIAGARTQSTPWWPTVMRLAFGVVFLIDAVLKWLPGYRHTFVSSLQGAASGQPGFLHGWFHFWIKLTQSSPNLFVDLTGVAETGLAIVLLFGIARRVGYIGGALYMLFVWAVGEGFGGPYTSGATDVGSGIVYVVLFLTLLVLAPSAKADRLAVDGTLVDRISWWRHVAEPRAADRTADGAALGTR